MAEEGEIDLDPRQRGVAQQARGPFKTGGVKSGFAMLQHSGEAFELEVRALGGHEPAAFHELCDEPCIEELWQAIHRARIDRAEDAALP